MKELEYLEDKDGLLYALEDGLVVETFDKNKGEWIVCPKPTLPPASNVKAISEWEIYDKTYGIFPYRIKIKYNIPIQSQKNDKNIFSNLGNGWLDFKLGSKTYCLSHYDDFPIDWLDTIIKGIKNNNCFVLCAERDPAGPFLCIVSFGCCYLIDDSVYCYLPELEKVYIDRFDFFKEVCDFIESNIDEFAYWTEYKNSKNKEENKKIISDKINELKALLKNSKKGIE